MDNHVRIQLTDIFTKALPSSVFQSHLSKMRIENLYSLSCRGILEHIQIEPKPCKEKARPRETSSATVFADM